MSNLIQTEVANKTTGELTEFATIALTELGYRTIQEFQAKTLAKSNDGKGFPLNAWSNYVEDYNKSMVREILLGHGYITTQNKVTSLAYITFNKLRGKRLQVNDLVLYEDKNRIWVNVNSHNYKLFKDFVAKEIAKTCNAHYNNDVRCNMKLTDLKRIKKRLGRDFITKLTAEGYKV